MKDLELDHLADREICNLSGGELQRFCICVTAIQKNNVYMFDEPSSYLDVKQRLKAAQVIRSCLQFDNFIIVVSRRRPFFLSFSLSWQVLLSLSSLASISLSLYLSLIYLSVCIYLHPASSLSSSPWSFGDRQTPARVLKFYVCTYLYIHIHRHT